MPLVSIVVPAYNVARTLAETLDALLAQTFTDLEVIVVNDGSTDETLSIAEGYAADPRMRIITQRNRGLAGARNTGIAAAKGAYIGFCDSDDIWEAWKLDAHVQHLNSAPQVGVSYAGSSLINDDGGFLSRSQEPRLCNVDAAHILKRNPVGNGSAPVIRKEVFEAIAYTPEFETERPWYFDENFRQSEDIECWMRIALTTDWMFEGVEGLLTRYRINSNGLSSATDRQLAAWETMVRKLTPLAPDFFAQNAHVARAYQLRYLARRAVSDRKGTHALELFRAACAQSCRMWIEEPAKTVTTFVAAVALHLGGGTAALILTLASGGRR